MMSRLFFVIGTLIASLPAGAQTVSFATDGSLKMLYDNRMYPQAVAEGERVFIVWRGAEGLPYIAVYDQARRTFSRPRMLMTGHEDAINAKKFRNDHHYAPIVWLDEQRHVHVMLGCHNSPGFHLMSTRPLDVSEWQYRATLADKVSYPKVHRIYDGRTLIYFRHHGHLGWWRYMTSSDGGVTWDGSTGELVDLDAPPHDGHLASHAGSYHTTALSADGRTLHVAFIWKVEDPVFNTRYQRVLDDHTQRYNLYYLKVDLDTGRAFNIEGKPLSTPVNKAAADRDCLVWDTDQRVAAVGPSVYIDPRTDVPHILLPVSQETPHACEFYFIHREDGHWLRTPITRTSHPFNSSFLTRRADGQFVAYLITGEGESVSEQEMDSYGWGDRVERWVSDDARGLTWRKVDDLTPVAGHRYQNIQFVSDGMAGKLDDMLLFYGWAKEGAPGTAYLWHERP